MARSRKNKAETVEPTIEEPQEVTESNYETTTDPDLPDIVPVTRYEPNPDALTVYDIALDAIRQDALNNQSAPPKFNKSNNKVYLESIVFALSKTDINLFNSLPDQVVEWYNNACDALARREEIAHPEGYEPIVVTAKTKTGADGRVLPPRKAGRQRGSATPREPKAKKVREPRPMGGVALVNQYVMLHPHASKEEVVEWAKENAKNIKEQVVTTYRSIVLRVIDLAIKNDLWKGENRHEPVNQEDGEQAPPTEG